MKRIFKPVMVACVALVLASCGGVEKDNVVGEWTPDVKSVDIHLSDEFPEEYQKMIDKNKGDVIDEASEVEDDMVINFKDDGKVVLGPKGDTKEFAWEVDGDELVIKGKLDEGPMKGKDFSLAFEVVESTADLMTIKLSAKSIYDQINEQFPDEVEKALDAQPMAKMFLTDDILDGTYATINLNKKKES